MLWNNLKINIQTKAGSSRKGIDKEGNHWSQLMPYDYGEIVGTEGIDKEPVDVIVGPYLKSKQVFICQMAKNKGGEDKCMLGFLTKAQAKRAFVACYNGDVSFLKTIKGIGLRNLKLALMKKPGKSILATFYDGTYISNLSILQPLPTGWNTEVENPGDKKLSKKAKKFNTELARRQGPEKTYVQTTQVARTTCVDNVY